MRREKSEDTSVPQRPTAGIPLTGLRTEPSVSDDAMDAQTEAESATPESAPQVRSRAEFTGADLENRFDGWVMERREKRAARTPEEVARSRRALVSGLLGACIIATVVFTSVSAQSHTTRTQANDSSIQTLRDQIAQAQGSAPDLKAGAKLAALRSQADAAGKAVATEQQAFQGLYRSAVTSKQSDNGAPNAAMRAIPAHRKKLAPYFDPSTFYAKDADAYSFSTASVFNPSTEIDPRFEWFIRYDGSTPSAPGKSQWAVETVMPDVESLSDTQSRPQASVVWTCRDADSGAVLAWAQATYQQADERDKAQFTRFSLTPTEQGAAHSQQNSTGA